MHAAGQRSKSFVVGSQRSKESSSFPNLSNLLPLLTMRTIIQYPKLCLLLYESLKPYICIFDNEYLSFVELCSKYKLLDFNKFQGNSDSKQMVVDRGNIRRFNPTSTGR